MINKLLALPLLVAFFSTIIVTPPQASAAAFDPARIIDDSVMTNKSTMTVAQIQSFLNSKVPTCDTSGTLPASDFGRPDLTHAQYAALRGWQAPPYTCLRNFSENGKTSAQIVYDVAQQYSINPQVFLVLLQKESSLITDTWPLNWQYNSATGYGCPDSTPGVCDASYRGLTNQITWAAKLFRNVINQSPTWYSPYIKGNNFIQWSLIASCGGSTVNVQNWSTAALYDYTPYQPNQAALNAGYGIGDGCSAYGNRNFFLYFNDWFGAPIGPAYSAAFVSQTAFQTIEIGTKSKVSFTFKNTGRFAWGDNVSASGFNPVRLATGSPINRESSMYDASWLSQSRPVGIFTAVYESDGTTLSADQHVVNPDQIAKFEFTVNVPKGTVPGVYTENYVLIREGASDWAINGSMVWTRITAAPAYSASYVDQSYYPTIKQNDLAEAWVSYRNSGTKSWYDKNSAPENQNPVSLATAENVNRKSMFGQTWPGHNRPSILFSAVYEPDGVTLASNQHVVAPGQIGKFTFMLTVPIGASTGYYREHFRPIVEGSTSWDMGGQAWLGVNVASSTRTLSYHSQSPYPVISRGSQQQAYIMYKNTGNVNFYDDLSAKAGIYPLHLATSNQINRVSAFSTTGAWVSSNRAATTFSAVYEPDGVTLASNQHVVAPGQIGKFTFMLTVPIGASTGYYREHFRPIVESAPGNLWDLESEVWLGITVI